MFLTPVFETNKIQLRPFCPDDAPALHDYLSHPELAGRRYIPGSLKEFYHPPPGWRRDHQELV